MLSKVHIRNLPCAQQYNIFVSEFPFQSYHQVTVKGTAYHRAADERVINVGNIPCRYLMFEVVKGAPLPCNHKMLSLFGVKAG
jgi:hypothetical protein